MKSKRKKILAEVAPLSVIIIIVLFIIPVSRVTVSNNTAKYLHQAGKILKAQDPGMLFKEQGVTRGPVFPLILAFSFKILGKDVFSASLATRFFFGLGIILTYLLGRALYNKMVGGFACLFTLTSYGINRAAINIDADIVLPFFVLLFILLYYLSLNNSSSKYAILAGIVLGLAFMVKESALFCFCLPLVVTILAPSRKKLEYLKMFLWIIGSTLIALFPWIIYSTIKYGSPLSMLGVASPKVQEQIALLSAVNSPFVYWFQLLTKGLVRGLSGYYRNYLAEVTPFSLFMIIGWFFIFVRGLIQKKTNDLVLTISVVSFLPLILRLGHVESRLGQSTMLHLLFYIILTAFIISFANFAILQISKIHNEISFLKSFKQFLKIDTLLIKRTIIACFVLLLVIYQFLYPRSTWKLWSQGNYGLAIFSKEKFKVYRRFTTELQEAAEWLKKNVSKQEKIIADGYSSESLDFFEVAHYEIPVFHPAEETSVVNGFIKKRSDNSRPLFLFTFHNFDKEPQEYRIIFFIYEEDIFATLNRENADYLVISGRGLFFGAYFDLADWACLKFDNQLVRIYEIKTDRIKPVTFENVGVNETIYEHLIWLEKNYPDEYSLFKEKIVTLGLTIDELKNSQLKFPRGQFY